ncbi:MAG: fenitrothion hydrolase [Actinomycetota bacterium]|nr:fenitrothion hydrolase [Actinomycetota bacterium]
MNRRRLLALSAVAAALVVATVPEAALAHGVGVGREDLPIPKWLFGWGASVVLIASFVGLAVLWQRPRLEGAAERRRLAVPRLLDPICGAIGVALFVLLVYAGFEGAQVETSNIAPAFVFVAVWVGLVPLSLLFGDVFKAFNPWRAVARAVAGVATMASRDGLPAPLPYPERLGRWPAAAGVLVFVWIELAYIGSNDPSNLATLALVYAAVQFVGMSLYGIESWNRHGDGLAVYFGLFARLSPLRWERGALHTRPPLSGVTSLDIVPGTVFLLCAMIGTTAFDGFSAGPTWEALSPDLAKGVRDLGIGQTTALNIAESIGILGAVLVVTGFFMLGVWGMRRDAHVDMTTAELAGRFVHSLVPIALAYVIAHYFSLLAFRGQTLGYLISDPLGQGKDLFGTANNQVDYAWVSATAIWYVQVGALVIGHVAGLILAHDRALVTFKDPRVAARSQYWMLAVMIAFTSLGLWLLSSANT